MSHSHTHVHDEHCDHDHEHDHSHDHDHDTSTNKPALWQATLIAGTGIMLLVKVLSGTLPLYVHVRYTSLIMGTGIVLLLLGLLRGWFILKPSPEAHHHHDHDDHGHHHTIPAWHSPAMLALLLPIILGLAVPSQALSSAAIDTRGFSNTGTGMRTVQTIAEESQDSSISVDTSKWDLLDWVNSLVYHPDNPALQGQDIEVIGFVWRSEELKENEFFVARFIVSCCAADSLAIYMPVVWEDTTSLQQDNWVRVKGTIGLGEVQGEEAALINAAEIIPIEAPAEPYLYP